MKENLVVPRQNDAEVLTPGKPLDFARGNSVVRSESLSAVMETATEAARGVQGGLLCRGILLSDTIQELEAERDPVIDIKDGLEFVGAQSARETIRTVFKSKQKKQLFDRTLDRNQRLITGLASFTSLGHKLKFTRGTLYS